MDIIDSCGTKTLRHAKYVAIICLSLQVENNLGGNHSEGKKVPRDPLPGLPATPCSLSCPSVGLLVELWKGL